MSWLPLVPVLAATFWLWEAGQSAVKANVSDREQFRYPADEDGGLLLHVRQDLKLVAALIRALILTVAVGATTLGFILVGG